MRDTKRGFRRLRGVDALVGASPPRLHQPEGEVNRDP